MLDHDFKRQRVIYSSVLSFFVSGMILVPLLLFSFLGWYRLFIYLICYCCIYKRVRPIVSRVLVDDQRYDPALKLGAYVKIVRYPHDFELAELMTGRIGYFELPIDEVGHIVDSDGIFLWVETADSYVPAHINCIELMPTNFKKAIFESDDEDITLSQLD